MQKGWRRTSAAYRLAMLIKVSPRATRCLTSTTSVGGSTPCAIPPFDCDPEELSAG